MTSLLRLARLVDAVNGRIGRLARWLILACVLVSAGNAVSRYALGLSSNALLEIQWYLFGAVFLLAAGYALRADAHVRIDLVSSRLAPRTRAWIDVLGSLLMLLPACAVIAWFGWDIFLASWKVREMSPDPGGLPRWPVKLLTPAAFTLLGLQGLSEAIKKIAWLRGHPDAAEER